MKKLLEGLIRLLEAYLKGVDLQEVILLEAEHDTGAINVLGKFDSLDDAIQWSMEDFRKHALTCEAECGQPPG